MKKIFLITACVTFMHISQAQKPVFKETNPYATTDKTALQLTAANVKTTQDIADYVNAHFRANEDKARAVFIWTATNIQYDVANMFALNFHETRQEKIDKTLKTGRGICENYAAVFADVAAKCGISAFVVEGYTKQNGYADYVPHAWCAARIDSSWYLFDPTWGAGYVSNEKFTRKFNDKYFKVLPATMITSHMPFDPMWELLTRPLTNQEFYEGIRAPGKTNPFFSYNDSISVYQNEDQEEQWIAEARRVEANGVKNSLIYDRLQHIKNAIEVTNQNHTVSEYNLGAADFNDAVNLFNIFIQYYNNQFKPAKPDTEIKQMIDSANTKLNMSRARLANIHHADGATLALMGSLQKSIVDIQARVDEQEEFMGKYLAKNKMGRKLMFHKYTWMGIPVN
jgi:hypothetical protein